MCDKPLTNGEILFEKSHIKNGSAHLRKIYVAFVWVGIGPPL